MKKISLPKSIKLSTNINLDAKIFNGGAFLMQFGFPFSINFPDRLNLLICNKYIAKTAFSQSRPPILASKISQEFIFVHHPFFYLIFSFFIFICSKNGLCLDPFKIRWAPTRETNNLPIAPKLRPKYCPALFFSALEKRKSMQKRLEDWTFVFSILFLFVIF